MSLLFHDISLILFFGLDTRLQRGAIGDLIFSSCFNVYERKSLYIGIAIGYCIEFDLLPVARLQILTYNNMDAVCFTAVGFKELRSVVNNFYNNNKNKAEAHKIDGVHVKLEMGENVLLNEESFSIGDLDNIFKLSDLIDYKLQTLESLKLLEYYKNFVQKVAKKVEVVKAVVQKADEEKTIINASIQLLSNEKHSPNGSSMMEIIKFCFRDLIKSVQDCVNENLLNISVL